MVSNTTILLQFISFILVGAEAAPTNEVNINTDKILEAARVLIIIGIALGSFALLIIIIDSVYLILKYISKKMSEPQYYIDDTTSEKHISESMDENNSNLSQYAQEPNILSVSNMVTSVKQSLVDLGHSLKPYNYDRAQRNYHEQIIVDNDKQVQYI